MAKAVREIHNICRLCLCQDEQLLRPLTSKLDTLLKIEDVERFTGIKINVKGNISYAICFACTQKLTVSAKFRQCCLNNDALFEVLSGVLIAGTEGLQSEEAVGEKSDSQQTITDDDDDDDDYEYEQVYEEEDESVFKRADGTGQQEYSYTHQEEESDSDTSYVEPADYSANYIDPGTQSDSDECGNPGAGPILYKWSVVQRAAAASTVEHDDSSSQASEICTMRTRKSYKQQQLCTICGKLVTSLSVHTNSVHKQARVHACPHCPIAMTNKGNLVKHVRAVHLKLLCERCKLCGKGYTNRNSLKSHMLAQHGIGERAKCKLCPKQFNQKSALHDHMKRIHSNLRPLECDICGKQFKVRRALRVHKSVHSDEQPYACGKCPKRFKSRHARNIHERTHSGVLFKCDLCGRSYRYKSLLNMHLRKTHPELVAEKEQDEQQLG
uniref:Protein krueppel n=1 Tax=Anopheles coluzzii TaxID=1518534 RepID=A0A6E8W2I7_ANOCL